MTDHEETEDDALTPFEKFENMARGLFNVPRHELDEEIAKEKAEGKAEKPPRTASEPRTEKAA